MSHIDALHLFGVENELLILRKYIEHYCHAESTSKFGLLLCGPSLSGKTLLLQTILREYAQEAVYIDLSVHPGSKRGAMERRLFQLPIEKKMYLFDNIDLISSTSLGVVSALIEVIDGIEAGLVIATCGRAEACHSSLLVPYRLYKHILLSLPSQPTRCEYLSFLLQGFSIFDTEMGKNCSPEEVKDCIQDVAQQTKGFSFLHLQTLVTDAIIVSQLKFKLDSSTLALRSLLDFSSSLSSSFSFSPQQHLLSSENFFATSLLLSYATPPEFINKEELVSSSLKGIRGSSTSSGASGFLIHGPSGCGKSALAYKLAYECAKTHKTMQVSCAELVQKVVGDSERRITQIFEAARSLSPCIIILDNIDTVIGTQSNDEGNSEFHSRRTSHAALDRLLSCLLMEIDGVMKDETKKVVVIATATRIEDIDRSLLRPGRLEEHIQLDPPTHDEMLELFSFFLSNIPIGGDDHERSALIEDLSVRCAGKTPSDIKQIVTEARMLSARQGITEYEEQKKNSVDFVSGFRSCSLSQLHFKLLAGINESAVRTLNTAF